MGSRAVRKCGLSVVRGIRSLGPLRGDRVPAANRAPVYNVIYYVEISKRNSGWPHIMKTRNNLRYFLSVGLILALAGIVLAQSNPNKTLLVNGKNAGAV